VKEILKQEGFLCLAVTHNQVYIIGPHLEVGQDVETDDTNIFLITNNSELAHQFFNRKKGS
jgi:hypothetical protein